MSPIAIVSIILLLAFAGFLAASESALTSISRIVVEELEGKRGGMLLRKYSAQPARYLNVILLVRKLCEFTATVLLAVILLRNYSSAQAMALTVAIMVVLSYVVGGELVHEHLANNSLINMPAMESSWHMGWLLHSVQ